MLNFQEQKQISPVIWMNHCYLNLKVKLEIKASTIISKGIQPKSWNYCKLENYLFCHNSEIHVWSPFSWQKEALCQELTAVMYYSMQL